MDELEMAGKAVDFLASMTHQPLPGNRVERESPYYFYERCYLPELKEAWPRLLRESAMPGWIASGFDGENFDQGCGALNLVNVAEPLKIARLILGIDDSDPAQPRWIPRLPPLWQGMEALGWPVLTTQGLLHADLRVERTSEGLRVAMKGQNGLRLNTRLPANSGYTWVEVKNRI
jgi:hypothetical protein